MVARSFDVVQGDLRMSRILNAFGDAWFSVGPALVLVLAGSPAADEVGAATARARWARSWSATALASRVREWLHGEASLREQLAQGAWIYLVDLLLAPIGFAVALAATDEPAAVALTWPLFLLLAVFARERDDRLASLLELSDAYRGTARVLGEVVEHDDAYTGLHLRGVAELAVEVAADLNLDPASASAGRVRSAAARRGQDRDRQGDHQQAGPPERARVAGDPHAHDRGSADARQHRRLHARRWATSSAARTSASTAVATQTASPATRFRSNRGSSSAVTPTTR